MNEQETTALLREIRDILRAMLTIMERDNERVTQYVQNADANMAELQAHWRKTRGEQPQ